MNNIIPTIDGASTSNRNRDRDRVYPNSAPRAARKHAAPRIELGGARTGRKRISKEQRLQNVRQKFKDANFSLNKPLEHSLEQLDSYIKRHLVDVEPLYLRQLLRTLHGFMPAGDHKRIIRGTLQMFTRWDLSKIWQRITKLLEILSEDLKINTFEVQKKIPITRIVTPLIAIRECIKPANREMMAVANEKLIRIRANNVSMAQE